MARTQLCSFSTIDDVNDNTVTYWAIAGPWYETVNELGQEQPLRVGGVLGELFCRVLSNTLNNAATLELRKNQGALGFGPSVSITALTTGVFADNDNTAGVAATDEFDYELTAPSEGGVTALDVRMAGITFLANTDTWSCVASGELINISGASATLYACLSGNNSHNATETLRQTKVHGAFTFSNLSVAVASNARTTDVTWRFRKNTANGNQVVTVGAGLTGRFEDATGTDAVVDGDLVGMSNTTGTGSEALALRNVSLNIKSTANQGLLMLGGLGTSQAFNVTSYYGIGGDSTATDTTEANTQLTMFFACTLKKMGISVTSNTIATSASTWRARRNGANAGVSVSIAAGATGFFSDTSGSEAVAYGDEINYQAVTPNTSGSITFRSASIITEVGGAAGDAIPVGWAQYRARRAA